MSEMIGVITSVEDDEYDGKDFKKVTLGTGQVLKVKHGREDALKAKWGLLQVGKAIKFTMKDFTTKDQVKIPFVSDIETVEGALPAEDKVQEALEKNLSDNVPPPPTPAPQAVGMVTKEIGDMIRAKYLFTIFGEEAQFELIKWYRSQVLGITRIPYDGAKLPKFEAQK